VDQYNNEQYRSVWEGQLKDQIPDLPEYDPKYNADIPALQNTYSWAGFLGKEAVVEQASREAHDPCTPGEKFALLFPDWDFERAARNFSPHSKDKMLIHVMGVVVRLLPQLSIAPLQVDEKCEDYSWATVICIFAAAGHHHWPALCDMIRQNYSMFPYGQEDYAAWDKLITQASVDSGWPVTVPLMEWKHMGKQAIELELEHYGPAKLVGLLHVIKHAYLNADATHVIIKLHGGTQALNVRTAQSLASGVAERGAMSKALSATAEQRGKSKADVPHIYGVRWALDALTPKNLIRQRRIGTLPPTMLSGNWSSMISDPSTMHGFIQHGLKLTGVWQAMSGVITETTGSASDVLTWEWDSTDPFSAEKLKAKRDFERVLPDTYTTQYPHRVFLEAFPNLQDQNDAMGVLFDLPIYADLLRRYEPALELEYPMVVFLPSDPTFENSTNQGKTAATLVYASTMVPGIKITRIRDTGTGAPQARADVAKIHDSGGTLALDEWKMPKSDSHILSHDNLQSLIVGGTITAGKAGENGGEIQLSHSITASAKCLSFPPDMINRCVFLFLDLLTQAQKDNAVQLSAVRNGEAALLMRLGAWADIEDNGIVQLLHAAAKSSGVMRFEGCNALSKILCELRGVDHAAFETAIRHNRTRFMEHSNAADDSGLSRAMANPSSARISMSDVFHMDIAQLNLTKATADIHAERRCVGSIWVTATQMWKSLLVTHGFDESANFNELMPKLMGGAEKAANRIMATRLTNEVKRRLDEGQFMMHPDPLVAMEGWCIARGLDLSHTVQMCLINTDTDQFKELGLERRT